MENLEEKIGSLLSNPGSLEKIMDMARSISGASDTPAAAPEPPPAASSLFSGLGSMDPAMLGIISRFMSEYGREDERYRLLHDLKPHLRQEKQEFIDQAIQFAKFSRIAKNLISLNGGAQENV